MMKPHTFTITYHWRFMAGDECQSHTTEATIQAIDEDDARKHAKRRVSHEESYDLEKVDVKLVE